MSEINDLIIPDGSLLVTLDVALLCTNIPHAGGIQAVIYVYGRLKCEKSIDGDTLVELVKLIIDSNNFEYNGQHYVQISRTSMGTKIGPNYANIFMPVLGTDFLSGCPYEPIFYKRFIDDIFLVWAHGEEKLTNFISYFNNAHTNISFSSTYLASTMNFLDVQVTITGTKLETTVYRKTTDRRQSLRFESSQTRYCKTSIPYSQSLRFRRMCCKESDNK